MISFLVQTVSEPTRNDNILDYVLTNNINSISHNIVIKNQNFSDHNSIITVMNLKYGKKKIKKKIGSTQISLSVKLIVKTQDYYGINIAKF